MFLIKENLRPCPVCHDRLGEVLHHQRFVLPAGHPMESGYDVVCCQKCGFVFADIAITQDELNRYYAQQSKYADQKTSSGSGESAEDWQRLQNIALTVARNFPDLHLRLLEIGCANGGLLRELKKMGYAFLTGIDPSPACVEHTCQLGIDAFVGNLSALPVAENGYDLVILSHVFEHVIDLHTAMQNLAKASKGSLLIVVPDATRYHEIINAPFQDFNTEHINHFSHQALRSLCGQHGYSVSLEERQQFEITAGKWRATLLGIYTYQGKPSQDISNDPELKNAILNYIGISNKLLKIMDRTIQEITSTHSEWIVWGTGQLALKLLAETALGKVNIAAFVDGNPVNQGKILLGKPILAPVQLASSATPILITTTLHSQAIQAAIRSLHLQNPVFTLSIPEG